MGILGGITGAIGGLLTTGNPIGAIAGGIAGLTGGGESRQTMSIRELSPAQKKVIAEAMKTMPGLFAGLNPGSRDSLAEQLGQRYSSILIDQTKRAFAQQEGQVQAQFARSGGGPSSVINSQRAELAAAGSRAANAAALQGETMGEQVAGSRYGQNLQAALGVGGLVNQTYQGQGVGQITAQAAGSSGLQQGLGVLATGLTHPMSAYNQGQVGLGAFTAPIFGVPKKLPAAEASVLPSMTLGMPT